ncbi:MAG: VCBS repeat-containing protein [Hyphomonadaceae bacterium]|nr:VCBS repeat-containing protein [Hyphomonadaceae bacterium]
MSHPALPSRLALLLLAGSCLLPVWAHATPLWRDASDTLPDKEPPGNSMHAIPHDVDSDGDIDLLVPMEHRANRLLLNDGRGRFTDASDRLPSARRDSEEIALIDVDRDGDLDVAVANEDDVRPELYIAQSDGRYSNGNDRLPIRVKANAVVAFDANTDGNTDLFFGGDGVSVLMIGDGAGGFTDQSVSRLPDASGSTQDVALGDVDGDGDADLVLGNQDGNQIYLNTGTGRFTRASAGAIEPPYKPEETRDVELFDVDGDGDLDLFFANVVMFNPRAEAQNRLLLNNGRGQFQDVTTAWLPVNTHGDLSALPIDFDADGRPDLITTSMPGPDGMGGPVRAWRNTGTRFVEVTGSVFPAAFGGIGMHVAAADFDGDGRQDLFVAGLMSPDFLLLSGPTAP